MSLKEVFNSMPTNTECEYFTNDQFSGIQISWIETGRGFGQYCFFSETKIKLDNECDHPKTIKRVLDNLVDNHPEKVKELFHQMVDLCELQDEYREI